MTESGRRVSGMLGGEWGGFSCGRGHWERMDAIEIQPVGRPFRKGVRVPGSKSITNRALVLGALAEGESTLSGVLFADDTWQMIRALEGLGYVMSVDEAGKTVRIAGCGERIPSQRAAITCGNSGTTIRFLTAMLAAGQGEFELDGVARMRQRPIDQLVDQLRALGATIDYAMGAGFPPVVIHAAGLAGGGCRFEDAKSSQYISAVLMASPYARETVSVQLAGPVTSEPYVNMTLRMMEQFGVGGAGVQVHDQCVPAEGHGGGAGAASKVIQVAGGRYKAREYAIEPDASNASYFLAAGAICAGSSVTIEGLGKGSLQGDVAFADVLHAMGATLVFGKDFVTVAAPADGKLRGIELDMNHIPDMVQTLAVVALFAEGQTVVRNVWNLRVKETDRLAALETELKKLGAGVETGKDWISITPPLGNVLRPASIATYDDHRMAMAFAVAGLRAKGRGGGMRIENPECVGKTYPEFFEDLRQLFI